MPVTPPPSVTPISGELPNRGQTESQFDTNQQNFVNYQADFGPEVNDTTAWINTVADQTEVWANGAEAAAISTAADAVSAAAAAAAAEAAAGLTPDPDFGMIIATTANTAVKTSAYTAEVGVMQDVNTSGGAFAITPPASPTVGQWFGVRDYNQNSFSGLFPWVDYTSDKIIGLSEDCYIDVNTIIFEWRGATKGWCV